MSYQLEVEVHAIREWEWQTLDSTYERQDSPTSKQPCVGGGGMPHGSLETSAVWYDSVDMDGS